MIVCVLILVACGMSYRILRPETVRDIPDKKYEKIIKLNIWDRDPLKRDAGFVYVEPQGNVATDFPREEFLTNLDTLDNLAQANRKQMIKYIIKDSSGRVRGYYELLPEYTANIWESENNILLQIILPKRGGDNDRTGLDTMWGGGDHGH